MTRSEIKPVLRTIRPDTTLEAAAKVMARDSVGALLLSDEPNGPIEGIFTDRDLVKEVARGEDAQRTTVAGFFGRPVVMIPENSSRREIAKKMKVHGVRYLPLTDGSGYVTGMVSRDEMLVELSEELYDLGRAVRTEFRHGAPEPDADE